MPALETRDDAEPFEKQVHNPKRPPVKKENFTVSFQIQSMGSEEHRAVQAGEERTICILVALNFRQRTAPLTRMIRHFADWCTELRLPNTHSVLSSVGARVLSLELPDLRDPSNDRPFGSEGISSVHGLG